MGGNSEIKTMDPSTCSCMVGGAGALTFSIFIRALIQLEGPSSWFQQEPEEAVEMIIRWETRRALQEKAD